MNTDQTYPADATGTFDVESEYRRLRAHSRRRASSYFRENPAQSEDIVQDVFLRLCEMREHLDASRPIDGWIDRVTVNRCLSVRRRQHVSTASMRKRDLVSQHSTAQAQDLQSNIEDSNCIDRVLEILGTTLQPQQAEFVSRYYLEGRLQREIAQEYGLSVGYVCKVIQRAVETLRLAVHPD